MSSANTGNLDAFVAKLNPAGSALVYATYLGGSGSDPGTGIAVDDTGAAYLTGYTTSTDFPTVNPLQAANAGTVDAFVAKLSPAGSSLIYSTYLGGSDFVELSYDIAVDDTGAASVTGYTRSTDFPTANALQAANAGNIDAFVAKLNPTGSSLVYSTYLGGSGQDQGTRIAVDAAGAAYLTGSTSSTDFPTANPLRADMVGIGDLFVAKLTPAGSALVYSTYLGGSGSDGATRIAVDDTGAAYVTGSTTSTDFPMVNPVQATNAGNYNAFVVKLTPAGSALVYSTYLGGSREDQASGVAVDDTGAAYVTGSTTSTDFPTANPLQAVRAGGSDAFVSKLGPMAFTTCGGMATTMVGTSGSDHILGTDGPDVIAGLGGDDSIYGLGGNDVICGGGGNDVIEGRAGDDTAHGGAGDDMVIGGPGNDDVRGGDGSDTAYGGAGDDKVIGGPGNDDVRGGDGSDTAYGGAGDDHLNGGANVDYCNGGTGTNTFAACETFPDETA